LSAASWGDGFSRLFRKEGFGKLQQPHDLLSESIYGDAELGQEIHGL